MEVTLDTITRDTWANSHTIPWPYYIMDDAGEAVPANSLGEWARWHDANEQRCLISQTNVPGAKVVTMFFGHKATGADASSPLVYGTMIHGDMCNRCEWAAIDRATALANHERAVQIAIAAAR
jgi:hypothetical protein